MTNVWPRLGGPWGNDNAVFPFSRLRLLPWHEETPAASLAEELQDKEESYSETRFPSGSRLCALFSQPISFPSSPTHPSCSPHLPEPQQLLLKRHVKTPLARPRPAWLLAPAAAARTGWR